MDRHVTTPVHVLDWEAKNLPEVWKKFRQHTELMFSGPLRRLGEKAKVSFLLIWVGEKGRDIRNTWTLSDKEGKRLQTFYDKFEAYVTPKSNEVYTVNESATESDTDSDQGGHFYIGEISANCKQDEVFVPVKLSTGSKAVSFKLDTGEQVNVLPLKLYRKLGLPAILLNLTSIRLTRYTGNPLK